MRRLALACLVGGLLACLACSEKSDPRVVDQPYAGDPFPSAAFAWPTGPYALVSDNGSDTVSVIDLRTRARVGQLRAGINPIDNDGPHHLAFHKARREIFVALSYPAPAIAVGPHASHGSSTTPGKVARLDPTSGQVNAVMRADDNPGDIALSDDGSRLVVSHFDLQKALANAQNGVEAQRASLLLYSPDDFRPDASPRSFNVCVAPHGVALSRPDGRFAYVACYGEDSLAVVDLTAPDGAIQRVPVGPSPGTGSSLRYGPYAVVLSPDGKRAVVGTTEGKDLRVFDVASGSMTKALYDAGAAVFFAAVDASGKVVYVPAQTPDFLARVELSDDGAIERDRRSFTRDDCQLPHEAVLWDNDQELLLICEGDHKTPGSFTPGKLLFLDPATLATRASVDLGVYPDKVVVVTP